MSAGGATTGLLKNRRTHPPFRSNSPACPGILRACKFSTQLLFSCDDALQNLESAQIVPADVPLGWCWGGVPEGLRHKAWGGRNGGRLADQLCTLGNDRLRCTQVPAVCPLSELTGQRAAWQSPQHDLRIERAPPGPRHCMVVRASAFRIRSRSACTSAICFSRLLVNGRPFFETLAFRFAFTGTSGLVRICANSGISIEDNELWFQYSPPKSFSFVDFYRARLRP